MQRVLALRQCVPLLGFAGVCLVDKPTVITPDEELEGVCVEIRVCARSRSEYSVQHISLK